MLEQMRIAGRAQRLSEISEILDIPTTTAMRILKTLEEFDAVRKEGGKYKIGDFISNFADSVRARSKIGEFLKMLREVSRDFEKANGAYLNSLRSKKLF